MEQENTRRKTVRLQDYDYATPGSYFITVCVKDRKRILWDNVGAAICRQNVPSLSAVGRVVDSAINQIHVYYPHIVVDKYCIMPDHVHFILRILANENGHAISDATVSTVVGNMKRWVSLRLGYSIWQKSFVDRVIRNRQGYLAVWQYIDNNPIQLDFAYDGIDFSQM